MSAINYRPYVAHELKGLQFLDMTTDAAIDKAVQLISSIGFGDTWHLVPDVYFTKRKKNFVALAIRGRDLTFAAQATICPPQGTTTSRHFSVCQYIAGNSELNNHPNLVKFYGFNTSDPLMQHCWMRLYDSGDYFYIKLKNKRMFVKQTVVGTIKQVTRGLEALHRHRIAHRDIKTGNILLDLQNNTIVLADYDLSNQFTETQVSKNEEPLLPFRGTYIAPEQYKSRQGDRVPLTFSNAVKADVFALGLAMYHLGTGAIVPWLIRLHPEEYPDVNKDLTQGRVDRMMGGPDDSPTPMNLVRRLVAINPDARPQVKVILDQLAVIEKAVDPNDQRRLDQD